MEFQPGDLVFAKVRGYPPWPARIETPIQSENKFSHSRYNVLFYGTYETAVIHVSNLYPYEENKATLGEAKKRKFFTEALEEIEKESSVTGHVNKQSGKKGKVNCTPSHKVKSQLPVRKKVRRDQKKQPKHEKQPELVKSRSGRAVRKRTFSGNWYCDSDTVIKKPSDNDRKNRTRDADAKKLRISNKENFRNSTENSAKNRKHRSVETGTNCEKITSISERALKPLKALNTLSSTQLEVRICELDCKIKTSLAFENAKIHECLTAMAELETTPITADILKKGNPIVKTLRRCRNYTGNEAIRLKADFLYNKLKSIFLSSFENDPQIETEGNISAVEPQNGDNFKNVKIKKEPEDV